MPRAAIRTIRPSLLVFLLLLIALPRAAAAGPAPGDRSRRLAALGADVRVRLHRDNGDVAEGYVAAVDADTVRLAREPGGPPVRAWALAEVVRARREGSAAGPGFTAGAAFGAALGTIVGIGFVNLIDLTGEGEDIVTGADYALGGIGVATAGAVAGGLLGALVSSGNRAWVALPPADGPAPQHLEVQAGWATAEDPRGISYDGPRLQAWWARRATAAVSWGPEASWSGLGGTLTDLGGGQVTIHDTWALGGAVRLALPGEGLRPYAKAGMGWYQREDGWLGVNLGLGLLWRRADGGGPAAEVRWHSRSTGIDDPAGNGQWTASLGWAVAF